MSVVVGAVAAFGLWLSGAGAASAEPAKQCSVPTSAQTFQTATPAQENLDAARVTSAVDQLSTRLRLSVRVFRNNCQVAGDPLNALTDPVHNNLWSVTKSVVSLLAGIANGDGKLDLDAPIGNYLPTGPGWGDAAHRAITVRDLLDQTNGLRQSILSDVASTGSDPNLAQEALNQPLVYQPGTHFQYSQLGPALLAYVVQRAVGEDLVTFAQQRLFGPIGISAGSYFWLRDRSGLPYGYTHLFLTPPQLARLGLLMANNGRWNGAQVVPADYVADVSKPAPTNGCYGLLFWTNAGTPCTGADIPAPQTLDRHMVPPLPSDAYEMNGTGGQLVIVIPSLNMTVVTTGYLGSISLDPEVLLGADGDEMQWTFFRTLMSGVEDVHVPDPGPYPGDPIDFDVNPLNYLDPAELTSDLVTNPNCNVLFCDGSVPTTGLIQNVQAAPGLL
ncbi:MAG: serine hydrolase [Solirubrobacterales bacterium]|nr:serine hydrolase [Solirubrobacterales bacterium]